MLTQFSQHLLAPLTMEQHLNSEILTPLFQRRIQLRVLPG